MISGLANSVEPGMKGTLVKLDNYDNDDVKVVHWINENDNDDYSLKQKILVMMMEEFITSEEVWTLVKIVIHNIN